MNKEELLIEISHLKNTCNLTSAQLNVLSLMIVKHHLEACNGKETIVRVDESYVIDNYIYQEHELLFFINNYLNEFASLFQNAINISTNKNVCCTITSNDFVYYFDAFIVQAYKMLEGTQKSQLERYLKRIINFFPSRNQFGLWWEIYFLRNRIVHFTNNKYIAGKACTSVFQTFSSKCNLIHFTDNGKIEMNTTLLDIYKDIRIKQAIDLSIKDNTKNPFDILFPNEASKGHGKCNPFVHQITQNIYFDYADSGIRLIREIFEFLDLINNLFFSILNGKLTNKYDLSDATCNGDFNHDLFCISKLFNT